MRTRHPRVAGALALGIVMLAGCADAAELGTEEHGDEDRGEPDLRSVYANLEALTGTCTFANGVVTVTSTAAQLIAISKRAVDSVILVNGEVCNAVSPVVPATASKMKKLVINGSADDETLLLDFTGGFFAPGVASAAAGGIAVDLGDGTDILNVWGSATADTLHVGADGVAFNSDRYKDLTFAGVESLTFALGTGADVLIATHTVPTNGVTGSAAMALSVYGGDGNDTIVGGAMDDSIHGGPGRDTLSGGAGTDTLHGDEGADIIQGTAAADGSDSIHCGEESPTDTSVDVVSYDLRTNAITATLGAPGTAGESGESDSIDADCEGVTGGSGNDTLTGDANANTLVGGRGNDTLNGKDGADTLNGGEGNDIFREEAASNGGDIFIGGAGTDLLDYSARTANLTVTMDGSAANDGELSEGDHVRADVENILGGSGNDDITGNSFANSITGGAGNDKLNGAGGNDTFLEESTANGDDQISGGPGLDTLDYSARSADLTVTMADDTANDGDVTAGEHDNVKADVEDLLAGTGADDITGNDLNNKIEGGGGDDTIRGGKGNDQLDGSDAAINTIICGGGDDIALNAGAGSYAPDCELQGT